MSILEINKHQLYFKQTVISVKRLAWQPHQELLQGKTVQTQYLFSFPWSIPAFSWITVNIILKSNTKREFWLLFESQVLHFKWSVLDFIINWWIIWIVSWVKPIKLKPSLISTMKIPSSLNQLLRQRKS